ncbi:DUF3574 domain-containing protein [Streptomyces sp. 549]|uniref:DUF3574 domain-containing protein n=1 Tax=Streptomyces sp. 549 TaxID=3049076 RepID=UPI0024C3364C|nr:DUF3574 domain-containing protein [Streptomyces sp. 549]MDK1471968.1 DUF3574 domain-containing protein [Streptomyces sp. 549]
MKVQLRSAVLVALAGLLVLLAAGAFAARPAPFGGAAAPPVPAAAEAGRGERYSETRLFFGTGRHGGEPPITDAEFRAFLDREITPRFPAGLTLQEGYGQWRDRTGTINGERSYELILLYPATENAERDADIEAIRDAYTTKYELESVGRVDAAVRADF